MRDVSTADVLREAADRISQPGAWAQGAIARTAGGQECGAVSPFACSWCAIGAIYLVSPNPLLRRDAQAMAEALVPGGDLARYNDARARKATTVARLLRKAADEWEATPTDITD